ncbi:MAG TPA: glycosyltransferase family A protein [bacterium]|nr:glycosyltransferase family A protein [bacterium]
MHSVVVPVFNRAASSMTTVQSVLAQETAFPYEVIVVDSNSTDDTSARMQSLAASVPGRMRYVRKPEEGASAARNAGIALARGEIIAVVDDDVRTHAGWLQALVETYRLHPDAWCVGGRILAQLPETRPSWFSLRPKALMTYVSALDRGDATVRLTFPGDVWAANFSVRRDVLTRVGLFDTALGPAGARRTVGEESELCWRIQQAGGTVYYCGQAVVSHVIPDARMTKRSFRDRAYWQGRTIALLHAKYSFEAPEHRLAHTAAVFAKSWAKSLVRPGAVDRDTLFADELALRFCVGYSHQAMLVRAGIRLRDGSIPRLRPTDA